MDCEVDHSDPRDQPKTHAYPDCRQFRPAPRVPSREREAGTDTRLTTNFDGNGLKPFQLHRSSQVRASGDRGSCPRVPVPTGTHGESLTVTGRISLAVVGTLPSSRPVTARSFARRYSGTRHLWQTLNCPRVVERDQTVSRTIPTQRVTGYKSGTNRATRGHRHADHWLSHDQAMMNLLIQCCQGRR